MARKYRVRTALTLASLLSVLAVPVQGLAASQDIYINEIQVSTSSTDWEFIELQGTPGTDLSNLSLLGIESDAGSSAGTVDLVIDLAGQSIPEGGYWLGISPAGTSTYGVEGEMTINNNSFENSTATYLLVSGFTGAEGDDLDLDDDGSLDTTPWTAIIDAINLRDNGENDFDYGVLSIGPDGSYLPSGTYRCPDAPAGDFTKIHNFSTPDGTPGTSNCSVEPPQACGDTYTPIYAIQGDGAESPIVDQSVSTEGIVVGNFQDTKGGFYLQDMNGDGDETTSDGIFIFNSDVEVTVGDHVRVMGTVDEYYGLTELNEVSQVTVCAGGYQIPPAELSLPVNEVDDFEAYEGMVVSFSQGLTISEYYNFDRYGELVLTTERQFQPTALYPPGSEEANAHLQHNMLNRIVLDDGLQTQNPDPALHPNGDIFDLDNLFRGGDLLYNVTGVMDYSFGRYVIQPIQGADHVIDNPRPLVPEEVSGNVKIASFNVLNYFTTVDTGAAICGPGGDMGCRGADTVLEFERQHAKIVTALASIDADIVGLIEIENGSGDTPAATLVNGLNDSLGTEAYAYIATGDIGTDAIRVALIYKPARVKPIGNFAILDTSVDSRFIDQKNRPVLAQTFESILSGGTVTVAVNHLKSKGSSCDDLGDPNTGDGSGNCNLTRTAAAEALVDWLAADPTGSGSGNVLIIGDLNAYDKETPIDAIRKGADDTDGSGDDYVDLLHQYQGEYAYSYVFDGQLGYLDHALANQNLLEIVTGATSYHINTDEPDLIDYDMSYKKDAQDQLYSDDQYRSSDHDAILVGLDMCEKQPPSLSVSVSPKKLFPPNHRYVRVKAHVSASDNFSENPEITLVSVTSNEPDNGRGDGNTINDIVILDDYHFKLRAERSAFGKGRYYTITYRATDSCGNETLEQAVVKVPKRRKWRYWKRFFAGALDWKNHN